MSESTADTPVILNDKTPAWQILTPEMRLKSLKNNCRRGNSETEMLLMAYAEFLGTPKALSHQTLNENAEEIALFEQLLAEDDGQLFDWLLSPETSAPKQFFALIQRIRANFLKPA